MAIEKKMLNQQMLSLFGNEEIVTKLKMCKSPEECFEVTKSYLPTMSLREFSESMKLIQEYINESGDGTLCIDELDDVAGGCHTCEIVGAAAAVGGAAATAAAS